MAATVVCSWIVSACMSVSSSDQSQNPSFNPSSRRRSRLLLSKPTNTIISPTPSHRRSGKVMAIAIQPSMETVSKKKPPTKQRRVVVTGMGVETPIGNNPDDFYNNLLQDTVMDNYGFEYNEEKSKEQYVDIETIQKGSCFPLRADTEMDYYSEANGVTYDKNSYKWLKKCKG